MASQAGYDQLLTRLVRTYPQFTFTAAPHFCWSPATSQIFYRCQTSQGNEAGSLIHELGHALLGHSRYQQDFELLQLEVDAWDKAGQLAAEYDVTLDDDYVQDCLDSYRDWLFSRSVCPECLTKALQIDGRPLYRCYNCHANWQVTASRFCRPYRQSKRKLMSSTEVFADLQQ